jgi:inhibitor of KinA sporulation pathway (predicted exonuclease)
MFEVEVVDIDQMYNDFTRMRRMINSCNILVAKHEGMKPLGSPKRRYEDNIRMHQGNTVGRCVMDASQSV